MSKKIIALILISLMMLSISSPVLAYYKNDSGELVFKPEEVNTMLDKIDKSETRKQIIDKQKEKISNLEEQLKQKDKKIAVLEGKNQDLNKEVNLLESKVQEVEFQLEKANEQLKLRKEQVDTLQKRESLSFTSELKLLIALKAFSMVVD